MEKNVSLEGTFLNQVASFELPCATIGSLIQTDYDPEKAKTLKKGTGPVYFGTTWNRHRLYGQN